MAHTPKPLRQKARRIFNHFQREDRLHPGFNEKEYWTPLRKKLRKFQRSANSALAVQWWDESCLPHVNWKKMRKIYGDL